MPLKGKICARHGEPANRAHLSTRLERKLQNATRSCHDCRIHPVESSALTAFGGRIAAHEATVPPPVHARGGQGTVPARVGSAALPAGAMTSGEVYSS